jgi:hypothetical protein
MPLDAPLFLDSWLTASLLGTDLADGVDGVADMDFRHQATEVLRIIRE